MRQTGDRDSLPAARVQLLEFSNSNIHTRLAELMLTPVSWRVTFAFPSSLNRGWILTCSLT